MNESSIAQPRTRERFREARRRDLQYRLRHGDPLTAQEREGLRDVVFWLAFHPTAFKGEAQDSLDRALSTCSGDPLALELGDRAYRELVSS